MRVNHKTGKKWKETDAVVVFYIVVYIKLLKNVLCVCYPCRLSIVERRDWLRTDTKARRNNPEMSSAGDFLIRRFLIAGTSFISFQDFRISFHYFVLSFF